MGDWDRDRGRQTALNERPLFLDPLSFSLRGLNSFVDGLELIAQASHAEPIDPGPSNKEGEERELNN